MRQREEYSAAWFAIVLLVATLSVSAFYAWPHVERFFGWNEPVYVYCVF